MKEITRTHVESISKYQRAVAVSHHKHWSIEDDNERVYSEVGSRTMIGWCGIMWFASHRRNTISGVISCHLLSLWSKVTVYAVYCVHVYWCLVMREPQTLLIGWSTWCIIPLRPIVMSYRLNGKIQFARRRTFDKLIRTVELYIYIYVIHILDRI